MSNEADSVLQSILTGNGLPETPPSVPSDGTQIVNRGENGIMTTNKGSDSSIQIRNK